MFAALLLAATTYSLTHAYAMPAYDAALQRCEYEPRFSMVIYQNVECPSYVTMEQLVTQITELSQESQRQLSDLRAAWSAYERYAVVFNSQMYREGVVDNAPRTKMLANLALQRTRANPVTGVEEAKLRYMGALTAAETTLRAVGDTLTHDAYREAEFDMRSAQVYLDRAIGQKPQ